MVSSVFVDTLKDPMQALSELYDPSEPIDDFPRKVSNHFREVFAKIDAFQEIPVLGLQHPPESHEHGTLVRFRGMVQDTSSSPEIYLAKRSDGKCGGWGIQDVSTSTIEEDMGDLQVNYADLRECSVCWVVSVPGEQGWFTEKLDAISTTAVPPPYPGRSIPEPHKYPIPGANHIGVQVKVYDQSLFQLMKPTDIITFVGILSTEPKHAEADIDMEVPTLHVLFLRAGENLVNSPYATVPDAVALREELISWIAEEALGGDRDVAEWILLVSIAKVQTRNPPILPQSLTISHFPRPGNPSKEPTLSHILQQVLPLHVLLPLSLDLLNKASFEPQSKEEELHSGPLQLARGTKVLVTENAIQEGKVTEQGISNVRAIQKILDSQTLDYIFPFSRFSFTTDLGFIFLTEGRESTFFETSIIAPLRETSTADLFKDKDKIVWPSAAKLAAFRKLLLGSLSGSVQIREEVSQHIQQDFVADRQKDKTITPDDLIHRMTVSRLFALSLHNVEVTVEVWSKMKELDARRKARMT